MKVRRYIQYNGRIIPVRVKRKPRDTIIIQVYLSTTNHEEDEKNNHKIYDNLEEIISRDKGDENTT